MSTFVSRLIRTIAVLVIIVVLLGLGFWFVTQFASNCISFFPSLSFTQGYKIEMLSGEYSVKEVYEKDIAPVSDIKIDWIAGKVTISEYEGDVITIKESCQRDLKPGENLLLTQKDGVITISYLEDESIRYIAPKHLDVYIPQDLSGELNTLDVKCQVASVNSSGLSAKKIDIKSNTGSVYASDMSASNDIKLKTDTGRIEALRLMAQDIYINSSTGRIECENLNAIETISMKTDTGSVKAKHVDADEIECKTSTASISYEGSFRVGEFKSSTGSINMTAKQKPEKITAGTDTGSITVYMPRSDDFVVYYKTSTGKFNTDFPVLVSSSKDANIILTTSTGSIYVKEYMDNKD